MAMATDQMCSKCGHARNRHWQIGALLCAVGRSGDEASVGERKCNCPGFELQRSNERADLHSAGAL